jgi:methylenetetrahydrofolate dehydrogenase (NADP+)/methenyltetrahydrofolate cyclohydrolase/formyltetrahydrofolate synthetase
MVAEKIDGTAIARRIRERIHKDIAEKQASNPRFKPSLTIVQGEFFLLMLLAGFCDEMGIC